MMLFVHSFATTAPVVPVAQAISVTTGYSPYPWQNHYSCSSVREASWNCDTPIGPPPLLEQPAVHVFSADDKGSGGATSLYLVLEYDRARGSKALQNATSIKLQYNVTEGSDGILLSAAPDAPPDVLAYSVFGTRKQPRPTYCGVSQLPKPGDHVALDTSVGVQQVDITQLVKNLTDDTEALVIYSVASGPGGGGSMQAHAFGYVVTY